MERGDNGLLRPAAPPGMAHTGTGLLRPGGGGEVAVGHDTYAVGDQARPSGLAEAKTILPRVSGIGPEDWTERPGGLLLPTGDPSSRMGLTVSQPRGNLWQQSTELRKGAFKLPVKGLNAGINGVIAPPHPPSVSLAPAPVAVTPGPAPAVPPPPPQVIGGGTYTVRHGDSLWAIAHRTYGDGELWSVLYRANSGIGPDPSVIQCRPGAVHPRGGAAGGMISSVMVLDTLLRRPRPALTVEQVDEARGGGRVLLRLRIETPRT